MTPRRTVGLSKEFYSRDPAVVAKDLLGKILLRKIGPNVLSGKIVETEAYFGKNDPASRAYNGKKNYNELMFSNVGRAFVFMVHGNWLLNVVAHLKDHVGAVLIRSIEPVEGIEIMRKNRTVKKLRNLTNGPGKLAEALAITKSLNGYDVTARHGLLTIIEGEGQNPATCSSHRIGVKVDLPQKLRFFIEGNMFVS